MASRALSDSEVAQLLAALPPSGPYRRFVLAMLLTGRRLDEIAGLRASDVDLVEGTIAVRRTASPGLSGENALGPTKGRRARTVPIAAPLRPIIEDALQGKTEHDFLFPGLRGGRITSKNLSRALNWKSVRGGIKIFLAEERLLHWHDLRHTAAVMLFRSGVSAPDVQAILGHSSLAVTQIYADTRRDAARRGGVALSVSREKQEPRFN
ncbi:site-specific integrase [uncultured Leifsonia sp.]|uniref:tyrosine-type recombinase/integrase n=1 Tax=uncultured Leifsonia sp. TaxID=340359 RepID=UPI0025D18E80|nr:site-specific integrase [uncultured Leifsonia sp.]